MQPRCFDDSDAAHLPPVTREVWFYLLRHANHTKQKNIDRGQVFIRNLSEIQEALCWYVGYRKVTYSKPQITKSLRRLCESNMMEKRRTTRGVIITICKYDLYQDPRSYQGNNEGGAKETRRKREGRPINNNDKECNNEKNVNDTSSGVQNDKPAKNNRQTDTRNSRQADSKKVNGYSREFLLFWKEYPNKKGKSGAWKTWKKKKLDLIADEIMSSLDKYKRSQGWLKDNGQFIPHGSSWVNQERWEDEVEVSSTTTPYTPPPRRNSNPKNPMEM